MKVAVSLSSQRPKISPRFKIGHPPNSSLPLSSNLWDPYPRNTDSEPYRVDGE
jgi:hypothetical protein